MEKAEDKQDISFPACQLCKNKNGRDEIAAHVCVTCEPKAYFCDNCVRKHRVSKRSKDHKVQDVRELEFKKYMCEICEQLESEEEAVAFCMDCDEPELLCKSCAGDHKSMNDTKDHTLSQDLGRFNDLQKKSTPEKEEIKTVLEARNDFPKKEVNDKGTKSKHPGKPYTTGEKYPSDHINLMWSYDSELEQNEHFITIFKQYPGGDWCRYSSTSRCMTHFVTIYGLKADSRYVFKVKVVNDKTGVEGQLSEESDPIKTGESPAKQIMRASEKISKEGEYPLVFRLPVQENTSARNELAMTRQFILGSPRSSTTEKTILVVGSTGSGKSTLINAMANYIVGVTWEDSFRFTLIRLEPCEVERIGNEALSQTEWITRYTICSDVANRLGYTINLIDTPGFGDTRGIKQDTKIVSQIRELFNAKGNKGVATIDAVCFILKAPDARLTTTQKYIFESILALFGKDIKGNICTLITFADGQKPPVLAGLAALDEQPLPYETFYSFNNSALFVDNTISSRSNLSPFFWDLGMKSCKDFFDGILSLPTKSLLLTSEVLVNRQKLENTVLHLQEEIDLGLSKVNLIEQEIQIFTKFKTEIRNNENFEYMVEEKKLEKVDISGKGIHTTTCLTCHFTCHNSCAFVNDNEKRGCCAMDGDGNCTECPNKCNWQNHSNVPYIFKWYTQRVKNTYANMRDKYQKARKEKMSQEQVLQEMSEEIKILEVGIQFKVEEVTKFTNKLKDIALRPDPLSTAQYIELMIESEKREKKSGFNARIETLEQCKKRAEIGKTVNVFATRLQATFATLDEETTEENEDPKKKTSLLKKFKNLVYGN